MHLDTRDGIFGPAPEHLACCVQAFIGYKDHGDGNQRILFHNFVEKQNIHQLEHFIAQIRAGGGDDGPEDIAGGLEVIGSMPTTIPCFKFRHFLSCQMSMHNNRCWQSHSLTHNAFVMQECVKLTVNKGEQGFRAQTRMIIHFADAPCHGSKYHDGYSDNYPGGDPRGTSILLMSKSLAICQVG